MNYTDERAFIINFKGENARDGGGPYREAMTDICSELQSASLSILAPIANNKSNHGENRECWMINSGSESDPELFKFFGMFIGFAIRASQAFPLDLAPIFWKLLIQEAGEGLQSDEENEKDLKAIDLYSY
jgi:E3 ubiquitin-protein ligase HERC2